MMKSRLLFSLIGSLLLTGCAVEDFTPPDDGAVVDGICEINANCIDRMPSSRVSIETDRDNEDTYLWEAGDGIIMCQVDAGGVFTGVNFRFTLDDATAGKSSGRFRIDAGQAVMEAGTYLAVFASDGSRLTLPSAQAPTLSYDPSFVQHTAETAEQFTNGLFFISSRVALNGYADEPVVFRHAMSILEFRISGGGVSGADASRRLRSVELVPATDAMIAETIAIDANGVVDQANSVWSDRATVHISETEPAVGADIRYIRTAVLFKDTFAAAEEDLSIHVVTSDNWSNRGFTIEKHKTQANPFTPGNVTPLRLELAGDGTDLHGRPIIVGDEIQITSRAELDWVAAVANAGDGICEGETASWNGFAGKTLRLLNDIDMGGDAHPWTASIGMADAGFAGAIDGGGHTISNLYGGVGAKGLIGVCLGTVGSSKTPAEAISISSLTLSGVTMPLSDQCGMLVGKATSVMLTDCLLANATFTGTTATSVGGLIGEAEQVTLQGVEVDNVVFPDTSVGDHVAAIVGYISGKLYPVNADGGATVKNSTIYGGIGVGAFVGYVGAGGGSAYISFSDCVSSANRITAVGDGLGSLVGCSLARTLITMEACSVDADVLHGVNRVGGLLGYVVAANSIVQPTGCKVKAEIKATGSAVGGLVGEATVNANSYVRYTFKRCSLYDSTIEGTDCVGGMAGKMVAGSYVECSVKNSRLTLSASEDTPAGGVGGIVGNVLAVSEISGCSVDATSAIVVNQALPVGGICGSGVGILANGCVNKASITAVPGAVCGGIGGRLSGSLVIGCENSGSIIPIGDGANGLLCAGGLVGRMEASASLVAGCVNRGALSANIVGGLVGELLSGYVSGCYNVGKLDGSQNTGGLVGALTGSGDVLENCYYAGESVQGVGTPEGSQPTGGGRLTEGNWPDETLAGWGVAPTSWSSITISDKWSVKSWTSCWSDYGTPGTSEYPVLSGI